MKKNAINFAVVVRLIHAYVIGCSGYNYGESDAMYLIIN